MTRSGEGGRLAGAAPAYAYTIEPGSEQFKLQWTDRDAPKGKTALYYVRLVQKDQRMAWASPIWVTYR